MNAVTELPYAHRREMNGSWSVFETQSSKVAMPRFQPLSNLSKIDAQEMAALLNRSTVGVPSRLHRYAIQGLPGSWP